jgi:hypothetical protein
MTTMTRIASRDEWRAAGSPRFRPWIGPAYRNPTPTTRGRRLLVLGESHYSEDGALIGQTPVGFTRDTVAHFPLAGRSQRFFDMLPRTIMDETEGRSWPDRIGLFWNSVAFFNFVPLIVDGRSADAGGANRTPEDWMFKAGTEVLAPLLDELRPEAVIVCGVRLWGYVVPHLEGFSGWARDMDGFDDGRAVFGKIHHPSAPGFSPARWSPCVSTLLEMAGEPRVQGHRWTWAEPGR